MHLQPLYTCAQALAAIKARISGIYDDPDLVRLGPLSETTDDIERILAACQAPPSDTPVIAIVSSGGSMDAYAEDPALVGARFVHLDLDVEGLEPDEMHTTRFTDGSTCIHSSRTGVILKSELVTPQIGALPRVSSAPSPDASPTFAVVLNGGIVSDVIAHDPRMIGASFTIIDYDVDGADEADLVGVRQSDGAIVAAYGRTETVSKARIEFTALTPFQTHEPPAPSDNPHHALLLSIYPSVDLLPFNPKDHAEVDRLVRANETGDTLFNHLWRELDDIDPQDKGGALARIKSALRDVEAVFEAFAEA